MRSPLDRLRGHPKRMIALGSIAALLIAFRLYLPTLVTRFVNKKLNEIPGYDGRIEGVNIHIWRGAYTIQQPALTKVNGKLQRPFIEAKDLDLSVNWGALLHGALVAKIEFDEPRINVIMGPSEETQQSGIDTSAIDKLRDLFPLRIDKLVVNDGELHYGNPWGKPPFDVYLDDIQAVARNLTNSDKISKTLVATLAIRGRAMKSGHFKLDASIDPFAKRPTFDLEFALRELQLKELNAFFKDSLAVEVNEGYLGIWSELSVKEGHVDGYVKPLVQKLDVSRVQDPNLGQVLKAFAVEVVTAIFHNRPHQQFGAKVELKGSLNKPDVSTWDTIVSVLGNAFIRALEPKLDQTVATEAEQDKKPAMDKEAEKMRKSQEKTKAEADKK